MKGTTAEIIVLLVYLAGVLVMVRPGSQGPALVKAAGDTAAALLAAATGGGSWTTRPDQPTAGAGTPNGTVTA